MTNSIIPHLWFDTQAEEAITLYSSLFENSKIIHASRYTEVGHEVHNQPAGQIMSVEFELSGQTFMAINAGPIFKFNPAVSLMVSCYSEEEFDTLWSALSDGGEVLMERGEYPFSKLYGWVNDKYGLSWQLGLVESTVSQKIIPSLTFVGDQSGRAEEAMKKYTSLFPNSKIEFEMKRETDENGEKAGTLTHGSFVLSGLKLTVMDSALEHNFQFNESISFMVMCDTQEEIDMYWHALSAVPASEQCGWLKDEFGVSWQIVPKVLGKLLGGSDAAKAGKAMQAMLSMKKLDIAKLEEAYNS